MKYQGFLGNLSGLLGLHSSIVSPMDLHLVKDTYQPNGSKIQYRIFKINSGQIDVRFDSDKNSDVICSLFMGTEFVLQYEQNGQGKISKPVAGWVNLKLIKKQITMLIQWE